MGESNHMQTPLHCLSLSDDRVVLLRVSLLLLCQRVLIFLHIFFLLLLHILIYTFPYCLHLSEDAWWSTLLMTYPAPIPPISFFLSEPWIHPGCHLLPCTYLGTSWEVGIHLQGWTCLAHIIPFPLPVTELNLAYFWPWHTRGKLGTWEIYSLLHSFKKCIFLWLFSRLDTMPGSASILLPTWRRQPGKIQCSWPHD